MFDQLLEITTFIIDAFLHIWPYLLITIPLAVIVQMSGASNYINRAFQGRPIVAIFLATAVGAFSPFCSCGVIPVVAALLIGGVPLAPVMAFWVASPSMDPETFFLSVAMLGWELAVWRLMATLVLSLSAGFATHFIVQQGWLGNSILRSRQTPSVQSSWALLKQGWRKVRASLNSAPAIGFAPNASKLAPQAACCTPLETATVSVLPSVEFATAGQLTGQSLGGPPQTDMPETDATSSCSDGCGSTNNANSSCSIKPASFRRQLLNETWKATSMVIKFMALAFFLEALITLYIPSEWIAGLLGQDNFWAITVAAIIGVPVYTSNLAALPMVGGLLTQGMSPAAGLAFLVAGPTTTLPAMAAVWGLTTRRVFALYVSISLIGAVFAGYVYHVVSGF